MENDPVQQPFKSPDDQLHLKLELGKVFSPAAPIDEKELFAGRTQQVSTVTDAIIQRGQHVIIFGERGVGKTSLGSVLSDFLQQAVKQNILTPHVNCDVKDDYNTVWKKVFSQIAVTKTRRSMSLKGEDA